MLDDLPTNNEDQRKGVDIIQYALRQPAMTIALNAGAGKYLYINKCGNFVSTLGSVIRGRIRYTHYFIRNVAKLILLPFIDASVVVNKVIEADDDNYGYDAMEGIYVNMFEQGIIDPTKVCCRISYYF